MIKTISIEVSIHTLMEVLEKTGNPALAAHILDGTYTSPEIDVRPRVLKLVSKEGGKQEVLQFVSYEKWGNQVTARTEEGYTRSLTLGAWHSMELYAEPATEADVWDGDETDKIQP